MSCFETTGRPFAMEVVILNCGEMTRMIPKLKTLSASAEATPTRVKFDLVKFNVHQTH